MKKKIRKKKGKNWIKKKKKPSSILPVLFAIALLSLFSETTRTLPAGALSELNQPNYYNVPKLNPEFIETKYLKKQKLLTKQKDKKLNDNQIIFVAKAFVTPTLPLGVVLSATQASALQNLPSATENWASL